MSPLQPKNKRYVCIFTGWVIVIVTIFSVGCFPQFSDCGPPG